MKKHIQYVAFLRAINVSGRNITMVRLREIVGQLGFDNVRSYIQTGNIFFETPEEDLDALEARIAGRLADTLGYEVPTMVRTVQGLERSLNLEPFKMVTVTPDTRLCVLFLSEPIPKSAPLPLLSPKGDMEVIAVYGSDAFVVLHQRAGRAGNPVAWLEKAYSLKATARFFETTRKILAAAQAA